MPPDQLDRVRGAGEARQHDGGPREDGRLAERQESAGEVQGDVDEVPVAGEELKRRHHCLSGEEKVRVRERGTLRCARRSRGVEDRDSVLETGLGKRCLAGCLPWYGAVALVDVEEERRGAYALGEVGRRLIH